MSDQVTIYALCDDSGVRYVGKTQLTPEQRLHDHWARRKWEGSAKAEWLCVLERAGVRPTVMVLEIVEPAHGAEAERRQIAAHRARGCALVNGEPGQRRPMDRPTEGRKHQVLLTLPPDLLEALRAEAHNRTLPPATAARQLILEQLDVLAARARAAAARQTGGEEGEGR